MWFVHLAGPMDLGLDTVRTTGRAAQPLVAEVVRELSAVDMALLETERGIKPPAIKVLRDSHHAIARCVAEGRPNTETMLITGYSASRISILKGDPAFQELVEFYRKNVEETRTELATDGIAKATAIRNDAMEILHDRLIDTPEAFDIPDLQDTVKLFADRSGLGPQTKSTNLNVTMNLAARVSAGRQRAARLVSAPTVLAVPQGQSAPIEGEVVARTPPSPPLAPKED